MALDGVFREHWARVLATLVGILGDIELAEDAAQEAFAIAAERWPPDGEPDNPVGWLIWTARNRAIDHIRRQRVLAEKTKLLAREFTVESEATVYESATFPDERLAPGRPRRGPATPAFQGFGIGSQSGPIQEPSPPGHEGAERSCLPARRYLPGSGNR
jgi:hypothetical protein